MTNDSFLLTNKYLLIVQNIAAYHAGPASPSRAVVSTNRKILKFQVQKCSKKYLWDIRSGPWCAHVRIDAQTQHTGRSIRLPEKLLFQMEYAHGR